MLFTTGLIWYYPVHLGLTHCWGLLDDWTYPAGHGWHEYLSLDYLVVHWGHSANGLTMHWVLNSSGTSLGKAQFLHLPHYYASTWSWMAYCPLHGCGVIHVSRFLFLGSTTCPSGHGAHSYPWFTLLWVQSQTANGLLTHLVWVASGIYVGKLHGLQLAQFWLSLGVLMDIWSQVWTGVHSFTLFGFTTYPTGQGMHWYPSTLLLLKHPH